MTTKIYSVQGLDCATCAQKLEKGLKPLDAGAEVDFATSKLRVHHGVELDQLQQRVKALGYELVVDQPKGQVSFWRYLAQRHDTRLALMGGGMILMILLGMLIGLPVSVANALLIGAMALMAYPLARSGLNNLWVNRDFNVNLLMTIAAVGAVLLGEYLESATVIFLFVIGEALEGYTTNRARSSIKSLMSLAPAQAIQLNDGQEKVVGVEELAVGDVILIKPGERVPMDGRIVMGTSDVSQAPITGESLPVLKIPGDEVFAGTINGAGALEVEVTHLAEDNTLSRIIRLVEEAQSVRAPSQRLIDQFARWYTPGVVALATLIAVVPPVVFGAPFWGADGWFYRALALLVISCPCALVISTPVTVISALTAGARRGVLIKGGAHLEALAGIRAFAFDKTGTLTRGEPMVVTTRSDECETELRCPACDDLLALAAAVERRSTHPLAQAVVLAAERRGVLNTYAPAENVAMLAGLGVQGQVNDRTITVGSHRLIEQNFAHNPRLHDQVSMAESAGQTAILLHDEGRVKGYIVLTDAVRPESISVIDTLKRMDITTIMLTGDNATVAAAVGQQVGIDDLRAHLLPQDKSAAVRDLLETYGRVVMVGDGVNDAPALATATLGIAMGGAGSAQALETADLVLMADDLQQLPFVIRLSRFARRLIAQNIIFSFVVKFLFVMLAFGGITTLWLAILADVGVSLLVTLNGMRPLQFAARQHQG